MSVTDVYSLDTCDVAEVSAPYACRLAGLSGMFISFALILMEDLIFDTPAVDLIGDNDGWGTYYWMNNDEDQEDLIDQIPSHY